MTKILSERSNTLQCLLKNTIISYCKEDEKSPGPINPKLYVILPKGIVNVPRVLHVQEILAQFLNIVS